MPGRPLAAESASDVIEHVFRASLGIIAETPPGRLDDLPWSLMARAQTQCELLEREVLRRGPQPACREGCSWCCLGTRLEVLAPEAIIVADALSAEDAEDRKLRVRRTAQQTQGLSAEQRHRQRVACPLLDPVRGRCSVHSVRPIACRALSSMQASDCERALAHPDADGKIEKHLPLLLSQSAVAKGLRLAFGRARLDARVFDGPAAIDLALAAPDAARRWARGESVFSAAWITDGTAEVSVGPSKNQRKARRRARRR